MGEMMFVRLGKGESKPRSGAPSSCFGFIYSVTETEAIPLPDPISFQFKEGYTILYLYDVSEKDFVSRKFLMKYGSSLNKQSSENFDIITYFDASIASASGWWDLMTCLRTFASNGLSEEKATSILKRFEENFDVTSLPALVVVKKDKDEIHSVTLSLEDPKSEDNIYNVFKQVTKLLLEYPNENFGVLSKRIFGLDCFPKMKGKEGAVAFLEEKIKKAGRSQDWVCDLLGYSDRNFRQKRSSCRFDRTECLELAKVLHMSILETDLFLRYFGYSDLDSSEDKTTIRELLE